MQTRHQRRSHDEDAVLGLVQEHAPELLRFARRFSHCPDDAHDAYQRTIEVLVRRIRIEPPAHPLPWFRTVLRNEALTLRAQREQLVGWTEANLDRYAGPHLDDPAERAVGAEHLRHAVEALQRLKPQELTALVLRAEGLSYKEICARTGWTYTKCNRAITEGRRALLERMGAIESGAECERWLPSLSALADGEATAAQLVELRPHLRSCSACRATLRCAHRVPAQVAALVPPALLPLAAADPGGTWLGHVEVALHALADRVTRAVLRLQGALDGLPGAKVAAVAASTAAIAGGGAALQHAADREPARPAVQRVGAAVVPATAPTRLVTIAGPLRVAAARATRTHGAGRRSEFDSPRAPRPEFASARPEPAAEFAATDPASPPASPIRAAPSSTASTGPPAFGPSAPSEFGRP